MRPRPAAGTGDVYDNILTVSGGTVRGNNTTGGRNEGGGNAYGNTLNITDGIIETGIVAGGRTLGGGDAYGNTLNISGGTFSGAAGDFYGGYAIGGGNTNNNTVFVSGTLPAIDGVVYGGYTDTGNANGNSVDFSGTLIDGTITGGRTGSGQQAVNNSVTIRSSAVLGTDTWLRGSGGTPSVDGFSGNKLTIEPMSAPMQFGQVNRFEYYDLTLPAGFSAGNTLITITGGTDTILNNAANPGQLAKFTLNTTSGTPLMKAGDYFTVISNTDMATPGQKYESAATGLRGIGVQYTYDLENQTTIGATPAALIATVTGVSANPETKPMTHVNTGTAVFLNQAADFVVN